MSPCPFANDSLTVDEMSRSESNQVRETHQRLQASPTVRVNKHVQLMNINEYGTHINNVNHVIDGA
jgi:hypothetical protein